MQGAATRARAERVIHESTQWAVDMIAGLAARRGGMSTPAALASVGEGRVSVLLGFEPAWPAARVLGPAFTAQGGAR